LTTPDKPVRRFLRKLYRVILLPVFALLVLASMWAAVAYQVRQEHAGARHEAVLHSQAQARTLAEHTSHLLRQTEHATQLFKLQYEETGGALRLAEFTRKGGLLDSLMPARLELPIALYRADGTLVESLHGSFPAQIGGLPFFKLLSQARDDTAQASNPMVEPSTRKWQIQIARRLNGHAGNFAGVIMLMVDPAYFIEDYDRLHVEQDGLVMLVSRDTGLAIGRIGERLYISDSIDFTTTIDADGAADELTLKRPLDGIERIYSYRDMPRYALTAVVGDTVSAAMLKFERQRRIYIALAALVSVLVAGFTALLMQQSLRLRRSMRAATANQAELAAVNDASPLGLLRADATGHCTYVNRTFETITGLTREQALGDAWMSGVHPNDRAVLAGALAHLRDTLQPFQDTLRCVHPDGTIVWTSMKVAPILIDGNIHGFVVTLDDITQMRKSVMAVRESEARLRTIADTLPAMIAYVDFDEVYRFNNLAYEREFSDLGVDVVGKTVQEALGEARYQPLQPYIQRALSGETLSFEEDDTSGDIARSFEVIYIPQFDEDGATVLGFHVMRQDTTAQKREKLRLLKLSQVDALTGLGNRAGFLQKLNDTMAYCRESGAQMALMYMDIDRFKPVNDTYGHSVGDSLLKAFSARLTHAVRASDTIGRLGGDEFTIIVERIARTEDAANLAAKIVSVMQAPFELETVTVSVSTSIGLTYYRDEAMSAADILNRADMLLYQAKQAGRNTYRAGPPQPGLHAAPDAA
jgi:diguanylate cyclase (GGDEF)-like protein/PAS domain S-box-containing protein